MRLEKIWSVQGEDNVASQILQWSCRAMGAQMLDPKYAYNSPRMQTSRFKASSACGMAVRVCKNLTPLHDAESLAQGTGRQSKASRQLRSVFQLTSVKCVVWLPFFGAASGIPRRGVASNHLPTDPLLTLPTPKCKK